MFDARKGQITITRGDTGLLAIVPTGYVPTSQDRMLFMVAEMPDGRIVINKTVTPDDDGVCKLMFSGTDTENLSKRHRAYTYAIRFALDVTESNGKITGYREMITPEPPGCFVVLEANGCPACTCETKNVSNMEVKLESFRGPKGDRGAKGEPGKDAVIDATLTQEGEAADAKATGKRLAEIEKAVAEKAVAEKADKARQNILIGTETGNPVSVSDAFSAPLCGLTVYGKSTQDGTPSPDNPAPIVSAGDGGTILVTVGDGADGQQTIALQTPNGLRGIPVAYGGNYTDKNGQRWICDEVDFERSILIRRIYSAIYTGTEEWKQNNSGIFLVLSKAARDALKGTAISNIAVPCGGQPELSDSKPVGLRPTASGQSIGFFFVNNAQPTLDDWKTALSKTNAHVQYVLKNPIEIKLTDSEIATYKSLTTYAPNTVVQASDGAGLKLDYQRDVNIVIKNLEDAIASMTTT